MTIVYHKVPRPPIQQRILSDKEAVRGHGWDDLGPRNPKFIVLHRMVGTLWGTDGYFRNPSVASLTDFGIGIASIDGPANAGKILQWNDYKGRRSGWASGPVNGAYGDGLAVVQKYGINAVNRDGVSIEISGTDEPLDAVSWKALVHLCAYLIDEMRIPYTSLPKNPHTGINVLIWHQEFTRGTGKLCPFQWMMNNTNRLYNDVAAFLKKYQEGEKKPAPQPVPKDKTFTTRFDLPLRTEAGFNGKILKELPAGTKGSVLGEKVEKDGIGWTKVRTDKGDTGWFPMSILHTLRLD